MRTLTIITLMLVCTSLVSFYVSHADETVLETFTPSSTGSPRMISSLPPSPLYAGDSLIEEKIIDSDVIVRATMTDFDSELYLDPWGEYRVQLSFHLNVTKYLKGSGPGEVVAEWVDGHSHDSTNEAYERLDDVLSARDDRWDDREAIIFLYEKNAGRGPDGNRLLLSWGVHGYFYEDRYSLHSNWEKRWLPSVDPGANGGDLHGFLLDVPPAITFDSLRDHILDVTHELESGDGSEEYRECVLEKYRRIRNERNWYEEYGFQHGLWTTIQGFASGQPAGSVIDQHEFYGDYPDFGVRPDIRYEGRPYYHEDLFYIDYGRPRPLDYDYDGQYDWVRYQGMVKASRPLPGGSYQFDLHEHGLFEPCGYVVSTDWYIYVFPPDDTLHEFFFDPVRDGEVVFAEENAPAGSILRSPYFQGGTIHRLEWEAPEVRLTVSPNHEALAGHVLDFIELGGAVSLTLDVADATVDTSGRLVWSVASQPWEEGDKLMVRVRLQSPAAPETDSTFHPCDTNRNGKIDLAEAIDVLRLYFAGLTG